MYNLNSGDGTKNPGLVCHSSCGTIKILTLKVRDTGSCFIIKLQPNLYYNMTLFTVLGVESFIMKQLPVVYTKLKCMYKAMDECKHVLSIYFL